VTNKRTSDLCNECGKEFVFLKSERRKFCSRGCCTTWNKKNLCTSSIQGKRKKKRKYGVIKPEVRFAVLRRDKHRCVYCGKGLRDKTSWGEPINLEVDHIIPASKVVLLPVELKNKIQNDISSYATAWQVCNLGKKDSCLSPTDDQKGVIYLSYQKSIKTAMDLDAKKIVADKLGEIQIPKQATLF
jgi:5-methylcytosine-specific restriction endonuclease McrA